MKIQVTHTFEDVISVENLLEAWREFVCGKRKKQDVQGFQSGLIDNIFSLHRDLASCTYHHGGYHAFNISDPKPRIIHKASVRDRLLHHAIYRKLYPFFDRTFIADSFSCRNGKGTHRALNRFREFRYIIGRNNTRTCWILKCDIKKFFASVDHGVLLRILREYIQDEGVLCLLSEVIGSFSSTRAGVGLPLGNLTSQLFANVYMNEFDQWIKHNMKIAHYIRYADDFVCLSEDKNMLLELTPKIASFLQDHLRLQLHPDKVSVKTLASGVDFLGWVHFPDHRVLRGATRRRMLARLRGNPSEERLYSYLELLKHGNTHKIREKVIENSMADHPVIYA